MADATNEGLFHTFDNQSAALSRRPRMRTCVRMGVAGNSRASDERNRLLIALRGRQADRVMRAARQLQETGELTLGDAARICTFLASTDDERYPRAAARLAARITLASSLDLESMDVVLELVANLPDERRMAELLRFCEQADLAAARA